MQRKSGFYLVLSILAAVLSAIPLGWAGDNTSLQGISATEVLDKIVTQMEAAQLKNSQSFRPYTITREYKLFGDEQKAQSPEEKPDSEVIASLQFVPPNHKSFLIHRVEGSDRGKSIVEHVLEGESGMSGKPPAALTRANYDFTLIGKDAVNGHPCWLLGVKPHKDEKNTIRGKVWVDEETFLVAQVQGEMAKTPSWWLKKVQMTVRYSNAGGMWLPTGTYAVADVRLFGRHVLTSQAIDIQTADQQANANFSATHAHSKVTRSYPPMVGTGVYVRH